MHHGMVDSESPSWQIFHKLQSEQHPTVVFHRTSMGVFPRGAVKVVYDVEGKGPQQLKRTSRDER